jgi:CheY-like chemotaxis protein
MASQKILIVDDSRMLRMQIRDMLPVGNFEVLEAQDGVEALEVITETAPNLILLDFFMPRMNGWEVVQKVQSHPRWKNIPVVMMSGRREDVEKAVPELFDYFEFLGKPFESGVLLKAIRRANLKAKHRQQEGHEAIASHKASSPTTKPVETSTRNGHPTNVAASQKAKVEQANVSERVNSVASQTEEMELLKAEVQQLKTQNEQLHQEVEGLKKQLKQVLVLIKKKLG